METPIKQRKESDRAFNGKQNYHLYTAEDFAVWKILFERQMGNLSGKVSEAYLTALNDVGFVADKIPDFSEVEERLLKLTGWKLKVVPGIIPVDEFFTLLSQKTFPATTWLRKLSQLDYIEEPDMFHDVFGHIPLLSNKAFTDYVFALSKIALQHINNPIAMEMLGRLYWFTLEFGLIKDAGENKIYGAGIISSGGETKNAFSALSTKAKFDVAAVMNNAFRNDIIQEKYYVIESFSELFDSLKTIENILSKTACAVKEY
jgi:phenylalanine-4-hydroxylase